MFTAAKRPHGMRQSLRPMRSLNQNDHVLEKRSSWLRGAYLDEVLTIGEKGERGGEVTGKDLL